MLKDPDHIKALQKVAKENDGHCDRCGKVIKIYRYGVNQQMVKVLREMNAWVHDNNSNKVNFSDLNLPYRLESQRTKMRLHGLIAKYKEHGQHVANTWLITSKGGDFLRGEPVQKKVVVFDNRLLGHEGEMVTIKQIMQEASFEEQPISTPEAKTYGNVKEVIKPYVAMAEFKKRSYGEAGYQYGQEYELTIERLHVGKPVKITDPFPLEYSDIAAFQRDWKILNNLKVG